MGSKCGYKRIKLTQGKYVIIDEDDFERVSQFKWYTKSRLNLFYAFSSLRTNKKGSKQLMHRLIIGANLGEAVDHINGNGLDNRRSNLRIVDHATNMRNSHKKHRVGAYFDKRINKWRSKITMNGKQKHLGVFETKSEAIEGYQRERAKYYDETGAPKEKGQKKS